MTLDELKLCKPDPSKFLTDKKDVGFPAYTFEEACLHLGYSNAYKKAWEYAKAVKPHWAQSLLVKTFMDIHSDGYKFVIKSDKSVFFTDTQGVILSGPHKGIHFRDFEIELKNREDSTTHSRTVLSMEKYD